MVLLMDTINNIRFCLLFYSATKRVTHPEPRVKSRFLNGFLCRNFIQNKDFHQKFSVLVPRNGETSWCIQTKTVRVRHDQGEVTPGMKTDGGMKIDGGKTDRGMKTDGEMKIDGETRTDKEKKIDEEMMTDEEMMKDGEMMDEGMMDEGMMTE